MLKPGALLALLVGLPFWLGGCRERPPSPPSPSPAQASARAPLPPSFAAPPEITAEETEGFHDLVFYVEEYRRLPDGSQSLHGTGTHKGRRLGFEVVLGPHWEAGSLKNVPVETYRGTVTYRSTGAESDAWVEALDGIYGTKMSPKAMAREVRFAGMSLGGDPRDLLTHGPVRIKLFFDPGGEDAYAELYTNIDLLGRRLEVNEKDEGYRAPLVRALEAPGTGTP